MKDKPKHKGMMIVAKGCVRCGCVEFMAYYRPDGTVRHRLCITCKRNYNRRYAQRMREQDPERYRRKLDYQKRWRQLHPNYNREYHRAA